MQTAYGVGHKLLYSGQMRLIITAGQVINTVTSSADELRDYREYRMTEEGKRETRTIGSLYVPDSLYNRVAVWHTKRNEWCFVMLEIISE